MVTSQNTVFFPLEYKRVCNEGKELRHSEKTFVFIGLMLSIIKPFKEKGTNHGDMKPQFFYEENRARQNETQATCICRVQQGKYDLTHLAFGDSPQLLCFMLVKEPVTGLTGCKNLINSVCQLLAVVKCSHSVTVLKCILKLQLKTDVSIHLVAIFEKLTVKGTLTIL